MEKSNPCRELNELVKSDKTDENISNLAECLVENPDATLDLESTQPLKIETVWTIVNETRQEVVEFNSEVCLASDWEIPDFPNWSSQQIFWNNSDFLKSNNTELKQHNFPYLIKENDLAKVELINSDSQNIWTNELSKVEIQAPKSETENTVTDVLEEKITEVKEVEEVAAVLEEKTTEIEKNENLIVIHEVKSWDNLWDIVKNHYNLSSNSEILNKVKEIINLQTDLKLKNKLIKSKWNLIHVWDKIILK